MKQRFNSFSELSRHKNEGEHYAITVREVDESRVAIVAIHSGFIEPNTGEIARRIAANDYSLYVFEGLDEANNFFELHVTSSSFDEPRCVSLVSKTDITLTIHGCKDENIIIYLGGNDAELKSALADDFNKHGIRAQTDDHLYQGTNPHNICNRNRQEMGVQLEFSRGIRDNPELIDKCVGIIRARLKIKPSLSF